MTGKSILFVIGLCSLGLIAVWLMLYVTPFGIGVWLDSLHYVSAAESFTKGMGFGRLSGCGIFKPMTHYPPFYSFTLAMFSPTGLSPIRAARVISSLCLGITVILSGSAIYIIQRNRLLALLGGGLVLISPVLLKTYSWALSEPLFIPLVLAGLLLLALYLEDPRLYYLLGAGALLGIAFLTRYVGAAFIVSSEILLLIDRRFDRRHKLRDMILLGILSLGPITLWLIRNFLWIRTVADRNFDWHPPGAEALAVLTSTVLGWFLPKTWTAGRENIWVIGLIVAGAVCLALGVSLSRRKGWKIRIVPSLELLIVTSILIYLVFLGLSLSFFDPNTALNDRILIPVYILLIILLVSQAGKMIQNHRFVLQGIALAGLSLFLIWQIQSERNLIQDLRKDGQGYASSIWRSSMIVEKLKELKPGLVYSNDITAIYFLTGIPACSIPVKDDPLSLRVMRDKLKQDHTVLAIFGRKVSDEFTPYGEIINGLHPIYEQPDGVILSLSGIP